MMLHKQFRGFKLWALASILLVQSLQAMQGMQITTQAAVTPCVSAPNPVPCGEFFTYVITVLNTSPTLAATNLVINFTIPSQFTFVSACDNATPAGSFTYAPTATAGTFTATSNSTFSLAPLGTFQIWVTADLALGTLCCPASPQYNVSLNAIQGGAQITAQLPNMPIPVIPIPGFTAYFAVATLNVNVGGSLLLEAAPAGATSYTFKRNDVVVQTGASATYTVLNAQPSDSGTYTVTIVSPGGCSSTSAPVTVTVAQPATTTLELTKVCPSSVERCGTLEYTVTVTNTGTAAANNVEVVDSLSSCVKFVSAEGEGWTFSTEDNTVTALLSSPLPAGESASFTITATAKRKAHKKIVNSATASASNAATVQFCCKTKVRK